MYQVTPYIIPTKESRFIAINVTEKNIDVMMIIDLTWYPYGTNRYS